MSFALLRAIISFASALFDLSSKLHAMSNKLIAYVVLLLIFIGPFRWAFLYEGEGNIVPLVGFVLTLAAFFLSVYLLNKDGKKVSDH
jgi:hypothetical protein